ncbi:hypothetical protein T484DRAFT_1833692 [Baffinella frigidus]|nr:hypothetical protein T484DRAFT_1833692 [Cryptophyta sp. CCMP2293]
MTQNGAFSYVRSRSNIVLHYVRTWVIIDASGSIPFNRLAQYVRSRSKIVVHYMRTWLIIDASGSIPFDRLAQWALPSDGETQDLSSMQVMKGDGETQDLSSMQVMKVLRLTRVLKMLRAVRFLDKLNQLEAREGMGGLKFFVRIFRSVFLLVFVAHFLGCMFVLFVPEDPAVKSWMSSYDPALLTQSNLVTTLPS